MAESRPATGRSTTTLERFYHARPEVVWELWTTKTGMESWWGPAGFATEVTEMDVRPGGRIVYLMSAVDPEVRAFVRSRGTPEATQSVLTIHEVVRNRRLVTTNRVDFIAGVAPYEVGMTMELEARPGGTRLLVTLDAMHDKGWTEMAVKGWESQLENLARLLASNV